MVSLYRSAFGGLSRQVWLLALVMLINRSGGMVVAFLTLYLTQKLGFSITDAGFVMVIFGIGSICGTFLGGKLTDIIGYFPVQLFSLLLGGIIFLLLSQFQNYYVICTLVFFLSAFDFDSSVLIAASFLAKVSFILFTIVISCSSSYLIVASVYSFNYWLVLATCKLMSAVSW
jgi:predicted MFS family arabinose efflux permease